MSDREDARRADQEANRVEVGRQLSELNKLQDGWMDGEGLRPLKGVIPFARATLDKLMYSGAPLAHLYPTLEGELRAEWDGCHVIFSDDGVTASRYPLGEVVYTLTLVPQPPAKWVAGLLFDFFGWVRSR